MKKIIEVVYNHPTEIFIQRHIESINNSGINIEIVARHADSKLANSASMGNAESKTIIMPNFDRINLFGKILNIRYLLINNKFNTHDLSSRDKILLSFFSSLSPDLIHFHFASLATMMDWIPKKLDIPYTVSLRGSDIQVQPLMIVDYLTKLKETINKSAGVHSVCDYLWEKTCEILQLENDEKFHQTIYTTVPLNPDNRKKFDNSAYEKKGIQLITVGRLHWTKSYINLLRSIKELMDHNFIVNLIIIGDGPEKEALLYWIHELHLQDNVVIEGKLAYDVFINDLKKADAFIQSSIAEGFSNATAEAMAIGLPIFATDVGGTNEIIKDGENGFLLDPIRPETWWKKLAMAHNSELMQKVGENARITANEVFSSEKHARDFVKFYERALIG